MGKKAASESSNAVKSLFSADNPYRRKPSLPAAAAAAAELGLGLRPLPVAEEAAAEHSDLRLRKRASATPEANGSPSPDSTPKKRKKNESSEVAIDGVGGEEIPKKKRRKRKREELEDVYEMKKYGIQEKASDGEKGERKVFGVGEKRKAEVLVSEMVAPATESFDDESKLLRTLFVGNLPVKVKKKALMREFGRFGEVESVRIRSVPIVDSKVPRKGAIIKGKINDAIDSVHAYVVFKDERSARAALSLNMAEIGGNHIRVDMACPPRKKLKGDAPLYDRKRTVFVGNLPFDVKDEELYLLFCGSGQSDTSLEAVRVIRDPNTSLGKGIAYILFKTRDAANAVVRKRDLKIRDRPLRVCHAKSDAATPSKRESPGPTRDFPNKKQVTSPLEASSNRNEKPKVSSASLSYQGLRASKTGVVKKAGLRPRFEARTNRESERVEGSDQKARQGKRPAVAARKAKMLKKRNRGESQTPDNTRQNKKPRKH